MGQLFSADGKQASLLNLWMQKVYVSILNTSHLCLDVTVLMVTQKQRRAFLLLTERIPALIVTRRTLKQSAELSHLILRVPTSTRQSVERGRREGLCPCMNAPWGPELQYPACQTTVQPGRERKGGRMLVAWMQTREIFGKKRIKWDFEFHLSKRAYVLNPPTLMLLDQGTYTHAFRASRQRWSGSFSERRLIEQPWEEQQLQWSRWKTRGDE